MKSFNALLSAIAVFFAFTTFAQNPSEGYVRYDTEGMPRQVMNLEVKKYTGTDNEIANQARYFTARELAQARQRGNIAACV